MTIKNIEKISRLFGLIWIISIIGFVISLVLSAKNLLPQKNGVDFEMYSILGTVLIGTLSFGLAVLLAVIASYFKNQEKVSFGCILKFILILPFYLAVVPIVTLFKVLELKKLVIWTKSLKHRKLSRQEKKDCLGMVIWKTVSLAFVIFVLFPVWGAGYFVLYQIGISVLGYQEEVIPVSGTGSMYPTFPKGNSKTVEEQAKELVANPGMVHYPNGLVLNGKRYFGYTIQRKDIVSFANDLTYSITEKAHGTRTGFVKRVIGLPGDKIELRDGVVILNGEPQKESYTASAHSTFGGRFLPECKVITIPEDKLFVMGDNRKGSGDSRDELGLISFSDIHNVIPIDKQLGTWDKYWRNTDNDLSESSKIKLDKDEFVRLLNEKRESAKAKPLKHEPKLDLSSEKRGAKILEFDDFSFEATRSGYSMTDSMRDSKYSNITYGEALFQGYYEASELIDRIFEYGDDSKFYFNKDYQDIGIGEVEGTLNGCPAQVVVLQFAGYVPPNYKKEDIDSWQTSLDRLKEILPSWENIRNSPNMYPNNKEKSDRIIEVIRIRIDHIQRIVTRERANQWLTSEEKAFIDQDLVLYNEQESLAKFLNSQKW